jgi:hypothetical protein
MARIEDILSKAKAHIESLSASAAVTDELRKNSAISSRTPI